MAKFRDLSQSFKNDDRSVGDRQRHMSYIKEQIKSDLPTFLEELDIFRQDEGMGGNVQKITVKMVKEFRFIYDNDGKDSKGAIGQSRNVKQGDILLKGEGQDKGDSGGQKTSESRDGGTERGKLILEITRDEIDDILDDVSKDLNLPFLSPKRTNGVEVATESRWRGLKENGIEPRLDLEASYIEKVRRGKATKRGRKKSGQSTTKIKFITDDLRYHGISQGVIPRAKVVIIFIMDTSGSMDKNKKYFAKGFCYALYNFIKDKYQSTGVEMIFIVHDTDATQVDSADTFFRVSSNGGTAISSGPRKAVKIINQKFNPEDWDIYCVHCSDGENNTDDAGNVIPAFKDLIAVSKLVGFLEIKPEGSSTGFIPSSPLSKTLTEEIKSDKFKVMFISKKDQLRNKFDDFLSIEQEIS